MSSGPWRNGTYAVAQAGPNYDVVLQDLKFKVIQQTFQLAARELVGAGTPAYLARDIHEAVVFVQGTGLNVLIEHCGLAVDADRLRESFFAFTTRQRKLHSPSSSATMWGGTSSSAA